MSSRHQASQQALPNRRTTWPRCFLLNSRLDARDDYDQARPSCRRTCGGHASHRQPVGSAGSAGYSHIGKDMPVPLSEENKQVILVPQFTRFHLHQLQPPLTNLMLTGGFRSPATVPLCLLGDDAAALPTRQQGGRRLFDPSGQVFGTPLPPSSVHPESRRCPCP